MAGEAKGEHGKDVIVADQGGIGGGVKRTKRIWHSSWMWSYSQYYNEVLEKYNIHIYITHV